MGDNAAVPQAWHNTVVGKGYQARGVVRQAGSSGPPIDIKDMTIQTLHTDSNSKDTKDAFIENEKRSKKTKKSESLSKKHHKKDVKKASRKEREKKTAKSEKKKKKLFNPYVQQLALLLSDTTRVFKVN